MGATGGARSRGRGAPRTTAPPPCRLRPRSRATGSPLWRSRPRADGGWCAPRSSAPFLRAQAGFRVLEVLVHEGDRHAALADGRGDALHRTEPHVAGRKDARDARFEEVWVALELPVCRRSPVGARKHVAPAVEC